MFTRIQSRALVVLSLGLVPIGNWLNGQSVTRTSEPSQDNRIELSYHVKAIKRDSAGQYTLSGRVNGELHAGQPSCSASTRGRPVKPAGTDSFILGSQSGAGFRILQSKIEWNRRGGLGSDPPGRQDHRRRQQGASGRDRQPGARLRTLRLAQ
jgi:hypothetical protein